MSLLSVGIYNYMLYFSFLFLLSNRVYKRILYGGYCFWNALYILYWSFTNLTVFAVDNTVRDFNDE